MTTANENKMTNDTLKFIDEYLTNNIIQMNGVDTDINDIIFDTTDMVTQKYDQKYEGMIDAIIEYGYPENRADWIADQIIDLNRSMKNLVEVRGEKV